MSILALNVYAMKAICQKDPGTTKGKKNPINNAYFWNTLGISEIKIKMWRKGRKKFFAFLWFPREEKGQPPDYQAYGI